MKDRSMQMPDEYYSLHAIRDPLHTEEMSDYIKVLDESYYGRSAYVDDHEYMNMFNKDLGVDKICEILENLKTDNMIKHLNLGYNIQDYQACRPGRMQQFHAKLRSCLKVNKTLTCLDLSYNHLFDYTKHPSNEHVHDYCVELTDTLVKSKIIRLSLSGNFLCGRGGREYTGILYLVRKFCCRGGLKALMVRDNRLHSQGIAAVSEGLGVYSKLEELDLRDNFLGLDPTGRYNSEGMLLLSSQISKTMSLRSLRIARNSLRDEDIGYLAEAIASMPKLQVLDLSGNLFTGIGVGYLKDMIISHSALTGNDEGITSLDLSYNNITSAKGMDQLIEGLKYSLTIHNLNLRCCGIEKEEMVALQVALSNNEFVSWLDVQYNPCTEALLGSVMAEVEALNNVIALRKNHKAVDADTLSMAVYNATANKLRFLSNSVLQLLYENPSFTKPHTEMNTKLMLFGPPSRRSMLKDVFDKDTDHWDGRKGHSCNRDTILYSMRIIFHAVVKWYAPIRKEKELKEILRLQKEKAIAESEKNNDNEY